MEGEERAAGEFPIETEKLDARITALELTEHLVNEDLKALRESEERYQRVFDYSNDAIFVIDPAKNQILDANPKACSMLGYSAEEMLSVPVSTIHPDDMPLLEAFAKSVFERGHGWTNELTCTTKGGRVIPAEISVSTVNVGGVTFMIALVRDITERKQAEEALRESEERYSKVFHHSNDAIFITDDDSDLILDANPKACELLGYSLEELLKLPISQVHQHERAKMDAFSVLVSENGEGRTDDLTCRTKGGRIVPCEISASVIEIGGSRRTISIVRDITERMEVEETSRELAVLEERNRIARNIHDSIAQGLTGIIWQLNVLERLPNDWGDQGMKVLERIRSLAKESLQEARRSVWDLRLSPLESVPLKSVLLKEVDKLMGDGCIRFSVEAAGDERVLPSGLENALLRICQESLANILKHADATEVSIALSYEDSRVCMVVRDNGVGFDPEASVARDRESGGFGLINMRERARLLQGELNVRSHPGEGTQVEVTLPLKQSAADEGNL